MTAAPPRRRGPQPSGLARTRHITIRVSARAYLRLAALAQQNQQTITRFVFDAVDSAIAECSDDTDPINA